MSRGMLCAGALGRRGVGARVQLEPCIPRRRAGLHDFQFVWQNEKLASAVCFARLLSGMHRFGRLCPLLRHAVW